MPPLVLVSAFGCGGAAPHASEPTLAPDLARALPAGASVVVLARPAALAADPSVMEVVRALVPDERWDRFRASTGVDPRAIEQLAYAVYDDGSVLLCRGPFLARVVVAETANGMMLVDSSSDAPLMRRGGIYHGERRDLIAVAEHELMVVTGSPALTGRALSALRGEVEPALGSPAATELWATHERAPLVVVAPSHLSLEPGTGVALLLAREDALAAVLTPLGDGRLGLAVDIRGELPPGADENFRQLVRSVALSDLGAAIGMGELVESLAVEASDRRALVTASIRPGSLARGLRALLLAEIEEVVGPVLDESPSLRKKS